MSEYARVINETGDHLGKLLGRQPSTPADAAKVTGLPDVRSPPTWAFRAAGRVMAG